jgi:demethylmacrocin O-methyltransferase
MNINKIKKTIKKIISHIITFFYTDSLYWLAFRFRTDKLNPHNYIAAYQEHFNKYIYKKINLLEIGVGGYDNPKKGGASLRMWKRFFSRGKIYAIDIYDKSALDEKRIKTFQGSQVDIDFLDKMIKQTGPFDIIIDDGSHISEHVIQSFIYLFPKLKDGGVYVIEDLETSYWKEFNGDSDDLIMSNTSMNFIKKLTDGLNYKEFEINDYSPSYFDKNIVSIHFYKSLVFIYKGDNNNPCIKDIHNKRKQKQ